MIISHKHRFCFVHIPKNAGSFMKTLLYKYHDDPIKFSGVNAKKKDVAHINMRFYIKEKKNNRILLFV